MASMHATGKSDSGQRGSTVAKQNPLKGNGLKQPNTAASKMAKVTKNLKK